MSGHIVLRAAFAAVACVAGVGPAFPAAAQELGLIYADVIDANGRPVTDLAPEEFRITEDGQAAEVVTAQIGTEPMKVALLVDNGVIIGTGQAINPLRDGVAGFVESLPPEHAISLSTVGGHVGWRLDFTTDRAALLAAARDLRTYPGNVRFIDGIREAWDRRFDGGEAWPVFVAILTDAPETSAFMNETRFNRFVGSLRPTG